MVKQMYIPELQCNKANASDIETSFLDLLLSISNGLCHLTFMMTSNSLLKMCLKLSWLDLNAVIDSINII